MNRTRLNQLSQKLSDLQAACQGKFSLDSETEAVFQELAAEIASHHQHHVCEQDNQLLYLEILRYFHQIHTFLDNQLSSGELPKMAEELLEIVSCQEFEKIAQYFV